MIPSHCRRVIVDVSHDLLGDPSQLIHTHSSLVHRVACGQQLVLDEALLLLATMDRALTGVDRCEAMLSIRKYLEAMPRYRRKRRALGRHLRLLFPMAETPL